MLNDRTFRTSNSEADTPGLIGMISLAPNTVFKFDGDMLILSLLDPCSKLDITGLLFSQPLLLDIVVGQSLFGSVDVRIFEFDAFFANDLRAAAKEDACEVWLESSNFNEAA